MKKLKINRHIYSDRSIATTLKAYQDFAITTVRYRKDYATVTFWRCKYDEEQTVKEFENYMIGVENS